MDIVGLDHTVSYALVLELLGGIMEGLPKINEASYIGDGVNIRFDGYQIWLSTNRFGKDDEIALEPIAFQKMLDWLNEYSKLRQYMYGVNE